VPPIKAKAKHWGKALLWLKIRRRRG